jgi:hypothetical protein
VGLEVKALLTCARAGNIHSDALKNILFDGGIVLSLKNLYDATIPERPQGLGYIINQRNSP